LSAEALRRISSLVTFYMYPALPKSYKGIFPFKIGTTSFIYPDGYVQNVKMLAPYLDEIELILFESAPNSLPSNHEIKELLSLSNEYDISYNIHLPLDISMGVEDSSTRHSAIETIKQVMDLTAPLSPTSYTLHLPYGESDFESEQVKRWKECTYQSMDTLCSFGFNSRIISIETLNYPLEWVEDILIGFNLSVCMDLGHLILYELDMKDIFERYKDRTSIIHLHGANENKDHQPLDLLSKSNLKTIIRMLKQFRGIVSIEVFSFDYLNVSLKYLESVWKKHEV
jgi:sugar phosphate isomerase/epimerase